jgi:WD40 repeat protein
MTGHTDPVISVAFSQDGKTLASGSQDKTIRLWDLQTGTEVRNITLEGSISSVASTKAKDSAYSMRRSRLAAAAGDNIWIWDSEFDAIDAQRIRSERIARNFLKFYPLYDEAIAAIRRNETLTPDEKDRIAGIIQPLIDFQHARAAANAIPLPENVFQP